jgi:hypothetical protein
MSVKNPIIIFIKDENNLPIIEKTDSIVALFLVIDFCLFHDLFLYIFN